MSARRRKRDVERGIVRRSRPLGDQRIADLQSHHHVIVLNDPDSRALQNRDIVAAGDARQEHAEVLGRFKLAIPIGGELNGVRFARGAGELQMARRLCEGQSVEQQLAILIAGLVQPVGVQIHVGQSHHFASSGREHRQRGLAGAVPSSQ